MMNEQQVIETLKTKAESDAAVSDTLLGFAMRERARHVVTLTGLTNRMHKEGFKHSKEEYAGVLKLLSTLGVGRLDVDHKGKVRALKDVRTTLQSLGLAAVGEQKAKLEASKRRNKFGKITVSHIEAVKGKSKPVLVVSPEAERVEVKASSVKTQIKLDAPPEALITASRSQHDASSVDVGAKKSRVQPRPTGAATEWVVVAVLLDNNTMFKSHVPSGLTKADAKKIGQAFLDLARG